MVLTGETYSERMLGMNKDMSVPIHTQFLVSSNNASVSADLIRRSLHCRIVVQGERPEQRDGFKYALPEDAAEPGMRASLLSAAFTILIGYHQAGRPKTSARPLGSYKAWCSVVQNSIVWAGMADPAVTQDEFREQADPEGEQLGQVLESWFAMFGQEAQTITGAMATVRERLIGENPDPKAVTLWAALENLAEPGQEINSAKIGRRLSRWRDKWLNDKSFYAGVSAGGIRRWGVRAK